MSQYAIYKNLGDKANVDKTQYTVSIENEESKVELVRNFKVCVFDIYGDWCNPCKSIAPKFNELAKKYNKNGLCALAKENVDLGLSPMVTAVPSFIFIKEGKIVDLITGGNIPMIEQKIQDLLQN